MLENAGTRMGIAEGTEGSHLAFIGNKDQFAGLYAAYIFRADHVECHGFRSENSGVAKLAHHQWTDAQGIAAGDHAFRRHADEGIGAFDRSEEHTSELQSLMRISYAVFCLKK